MYTKNVQMFIDAVDGTNIKLNASENIDYLSSSFQNYNARDVLGLVIFANPVTKKCLRLAKKFDNLNVLHPMPIVVVSDNATGLYAKGYFHARHSKVYLVNSEENAISDVDLDRIFTTLIVSSGDPYDLSVVPAERKAKTKPTGISLMQVKMSDELALLLDKLEEVT